MRTGNETSGSPTGTTSRNGHGNTSSASKAPEPGQPAPTTDEAAFLAQQAADAQAALSATIADVGKHLGQAVNVGQLAQKYPWMTLAGSTVAGFVAAAVLVPSKEDQALKKLAKIERALNPAPPPEPHANGDSRDAAARDYREGRQSFGRTIMGELLRAVQPAITSMLTAAAAAHTAKPTPEEMHAAVSAEQQKQDAGPPSGKASPAEPV